MKTTFITKLLLFIKALAFILVLVFDATSATASNPIGSDVRTLSSFSEIDISGAYTVVLVQGDAESIHIEAENEIISDIITKVENGKLEIYNTDKAKSKNREKILLTINFKDLKKLECSGAVVINSKAKLNLKDFDLEISGAGKTDMDLVAERLNVDISGAGKALLKGKVKKVDLDISGAGNCHAADLEVIDYTIEISGTGNATIFAVSKLDVDISGTGNVSYKGDPQIQKAISGVGSLKKI